MRQKLLGIIVTSLALAGSVSVAPITQSQEVKAISKHAAYYHRVKVTKKRALFKLGRAIYMRPKFVGFVKKGKHVRICYNRYHGFYYVRGAGQGNLIIKGRSTNWFRNL